MLAAEREHTLWYPTILGVLVVISAVGLFCGSVVLLLSTNLGAKLGFLVGGAALFGFLVLLSLLWITTATPLNSPKGRPNGWQVKEVVDDLADSKITAVRELPENGEQVTTEEDLAQLRPGLEAALVTQEPEAGEEVPNQPFAEFARSTDIITDFEGFQTFTGGGGTKNLFWHHNKYAVVEFCPALAVEVAAGERPPAPQCDPLQAKRYVVMQFDFGSIRQPPYVYFGAFAVLFGLFLLGLHWYEKDARAKARATSAGTLRPVPSS
jgi:hypothetical protein